ncbi:hypothetical protein JZK55_17510 [Dissulfurispira thermophila]|uniref:Uncharacterized protein n=1 Tax=Dissulfurispira thermophila TaxID=2715679 RepID=A0A7G1H3S1_9BACT|nr:hypothetical protein [Dissulfurispira thermophila]BCB96829.1 hypothetical protein JZK55_17510 [Dissulfurispira thermophila]
MPRNERQRHGFGFEDWLKRTFLDIHYTSEWDIPQELNPNRSGGPISIKTAKWKGAIYFGDALRRFRINSDFTLIVGFWEPIGKKKRIVKIVEQFVSLDEWQRLWAPFTENDLTKLDSLIKDRSMSPDQTRQRIKKELLRLKNANHWGIITLNPKIDSKTQRRLQCSLSFSNFFKELLRVDPAFVSKDKKIFLWGMELKPPDF